MGSKVCLTESYSLGQGTQNPWPRVSERYVSIISDTYCAHICHFN